MAGIESGCRSERVGRNQDGLLLPGNSRCDSSPWIDRGGHTGIGGAQQPSVIFYGSHARLAQVLRISSAVAVPAVVGNIHQHLGALLRELPHLIGENGFVADERSQPSATGVERSSRIAMLKLAYLPSQTSRKREQAREGQVFSKRNKVNFVVARGPVAFWINEGS